MDVFDLPRLRPKLSARWRRPPITTKHRSLQKRGQNKWKKKKNPAEIIMAERCWNKGSRGYENPPSQTCILAIWIRRRKGPTGISIVSLRPWYQVEDGACTSSFYLVWDWWLDWRAGREETRVLSLQHREEKAMFHKTTHSLLKINLHYTNAICIIRL